MANEQNLRPIRNKLEATLRGREGGLKSVKVKKEKKKFKELATIMLDCKNREDLNLQIKKLFPEIADEDLTARVAMLYIQYGKALKGDTRAFEVIRDTAGEKPAEKHEVTGAGGNPIITATFDIQKAAELANLLNNQL